MSICVEDVMVRKVLTIDSNQTAKNAARFMNKFGVSSLLVQNGDDIVGILTERDILARVVASGQDSTHVPVHEIMSEPIIVVNPQTPLDEAVKIMMRERIKKLPVMTNEEDRLRLVGIISLTDVARIQPRLIEEVKALTDQALNGLLEENFYIR